MRVLVLISCLAGLWAQGIMPLTLTGIQREAQVSSAEDGAAFKLDLHGLVDYVRNRFLASTWVYVESMTNSDAKFMSLTTSDTTTFDVKWVGTTLTFTHNSQTHEITTDSAFAMQTWFFLAMGAMITQSFGGVAFRAASSTWKTTDWMEDIKIRPTSVFMGPVGAGTFVVSSM